MIVLFDILAPLLFLGFVFGIALPLSKEEPYSSLTFNIFMSAAATCLFYIFVTTIFQPHLNNDEWDSSTPLANLTDSTSISVSGSFFLGSGTVSSTSEPQYSFYTRNLDGSASMHVAKGSGIRVFDNLPVGQTPTVTYHHTCNPRVKAHSDIVHIIGGGHCIDNPYVSAFRVPKGSIITNYSLDAQ